MRRMLLCAAFATVLAGTAGAGPMEDRLEAKKNEAWVTSSPWILDYDEARERAAAEEKLIFAYFTRSYAY